MRGDGCSLLAIYRRIDIIIIYNILTRYNFTVIKKEKKRKEKSDLPTGRAYLQDLTNYS